MGDNLVHEVTTLSLDLVDNATNISTASERAIIDLVRTHNFICRINQVTTIVLPLVPWAGHFLEFVICTNLLFKFD